jgi:site-specific recombinase XerD
MFTSRGSKEGNRGASHQSKLLAEYLDFLRNHRGLANGTICMRRNDVTLFLQSLRLRKNSEDIEKISASQIHDYVIKSAKRMNRPSRQHLVSSIRTFLKFCHIKGYIRRDLTEAVPIIGTPRLGSVPRGISWESVEKLLLAPDRNTHTGRRIYALLQLLATYGVRIGQAINLRLQDINWREGAIHFRPSKWGNPLCFPLYPEVADALLAYIRETRGKVSYPEVFLTICGKPRPVCGSNSFYRSLKKCYRLAGVDPTANCAHAIRHAFATRLMEHGTPIKTIADLLGHKSISTAFIYTKVDLKHLRLLAYEWPEVAQ